MINLILCAKQRERNRCLFHQLSNVELSAVQRREALVATREGVPSYTLTMNKED